MRKKILIWNIWKKRMIEKLLNIYGYSPEAKQEIAKKLGIGIATLYRKIKVYEL
ncbi:helix-turn-helix domain-containing protein [Fusobacterium ulcerans]|uniref:helix-turn-helix domain-containing protein n=1 Tax=Fusobacterium ulcerans TaxID=861 RepID=UPI003119BBF0